MSDNRVPWRTISDEIDDIAKRIEELAKQIGDEFDADRWSQQAKHEMTDMGIRRVADNTGDETLQRLLSAKDSPDDH